MGILGFLTSVLYLIIACRIYRYSFDNAIYISVFSIIGGLIGAKLLYFAVFILRSIPSRICRDKSVNGTDKGSCGQKYLQDPDFYYKSKRTPLSESPFASSWQEY